MAGAGLTALGAWWKGRRKMRAAEIDTTQTEDLADRDMLKVIYSAMVTPDPSPLNPHPPPGLIERVENIEAKLEQHRPFEGEIDRSGHIQGVVTAPAE